MPSPWGTVATEQLIADESSNGARAWLQARRRYVWRPTAALKGDLPAGYSLTFDATVGPDQLRHFVPSSVEGFVSQGALGGFAILAQTHSLSGEDRWRLRAMSLVFHQGKRLQEYFDRSFRRVEDLTISRAGERSIGQRDVLPIDLGLDRSGNGTRWSVAELLERGRAAAGVAGNPSPTPQECIRRGLHEAARLNPADLNSASPEQLASMVRLALFDLGPATSTIDPSDTDLVTSRLMEALDKHLELSTEAFDEWFYEHVDNIVHQISKKKSNGGPIDRATVRQVFVELAFSAFRDVGSCFHALMKAFCEALYEPLNDAEQKKFESCYYGQPWLGGIPVILLVDRFEFLREAVLDVLAYPDDPQVVGMFQKLLYWYAEMANLRRNADRQTKRQGT